MQLIACLRRQRTFKKLSILEISFKILQKLAEPLSMCDESSDCSEQLKMNPKCWERRDDMKQEESKGHYIWMATSVFVQILLALVVL